MIARRRLRLGRALVWLGLLAAFGSTVPPWQLGIVLGCVSAFAGMLIRDKALQDIALMEEELGPAFEFKRGRR